MRVLLGSHSSTAILDADGVASEVRLRNPSFAAVSHDRRLAYVVDEDPDGPGMVHAFRVLGNALIPHGTPRPTGGDQPCHLSVHPDGQFLLTAHYGDGSLAVLPLNPDGTVEPASGVVRHSGSGPHLNRQAGPHAHQVLSDPSRQWVLACDLGADKVFVYRLDSARGVLERAEVAEFAPGQGVRHLAFAPDGRRAYVAAELSSELVACDWDDTTATLTPTQSLSTLPPDDVTRPNYPSAVAVAADGRRVYVANRGADCVSVFDGADCRLLDVRPCGGEWPRDMCLSRDGRTLFVANEHSGAVAAFDVDSQGLSSQARTVARFPGVTSVLEL